jgi:hypothetical protein
MKQFETAAALLTNLLVMIFQKDDSIPSQAQFMFGNMILERFHKVLLPFENGLWILDSECSWAVCLESINVLTLD